MKKLNILQVNTLDKAIRTLKAISQNKAIILAYHRILDTKRDPQLLCVSPKNFESHLQIIAKLYNPISLSKLTESLDNKKIKNKSIVITFDDGYADNFYHALPLLEKYKIPATIFVTTGHIDKNKELWWDELDRYLLPKNSCWNVLEKVPGEESKKYRRYLDSHKKLKPLCEKSRDFELARLSSNAEQNRIARDNYRVMNSDEIAIIARSNFVEIGSHTVSHSQLSTLSKSEQAKEILESKKRLGKITGSKIKNFSYPFGGMDDIGDEACRQIIKGNYTAATANFTGFVTKKTDKFLLPRYLVRDWEKAAFHKQIKQWFRGK